MASNAEPEKAGALAYVIPFVYLDRSKRAQVESKLAYHSYKPGEVVIQKFRDDAADANSCDMFITIDGGFVCCDENGYVLTDSVMTEGCLFGERAAIFGSPRTVEVRAIASGSAGQWPREEELLKNEAASSSSAWSLDGTVVLELLSHHESRRFALALASDLRHKQGLFDNFLSFRSLAFSAFMDGNSGALDLPNLLACYAKLKPALHPFVDDPRLVDYDGWSYALRRLPSNVTSVYSIVCSRRPISILATSNGSRNNTSLDAVDEGDFEFIDSERSPGRPVSTNERRRTCWEVMPGKLFILLRELVSDYLDVLTCFCVHAIESKKLRKKLKPVGTIVPMLKTAIQQVDGVVLPEEKTHIEIKLLTDIFQHILEQRDLEGLKKLWPNGGVLNRLLDLLVHHGDWSFYLDSTSNAYIATAEERWTMRILSSVRKLVGDFDNIIGGDLVVDIVSSNTHSVLNCLCPYIHSHRNEIIAWGRENAAHLFQENLSNELDRMYPLAKLFFEANPEEKAKAAEMRRKAGILAVPETMTGISVQLYDLNRLKTSAGASESSFDDAFHGESFWSAVEGKRHLLINIDYAFGSQGESILRLLLLLFGKLVRSISVLGKAGGLAPGCKRGDILFPTHILDENQSGEIRYVGNTDITPEVLSKMSNRKVHVGPVATVLGTILQSRELLLYYEKFSHATGMEMEASWYLRAINEARNLGHIPLSCRERFLYYVSDTPLQAESSLAAKMTILEGVPPLYSITRIILEKILKVEELTEEDALEEKSKKNGKKHWVDLRSVLSASAVIRKSCSPNEV